MINKKLGSYLELVAQIAKEAGEEIRKVYYQQNQIITQKKTDASFVTEADMKAHHLILKKLQQLTPEIPILSEETAIPSFEQRRHWKCYWCVDPLDGTYEFVHRQGEFVVSIALIKENYPILGVIHVPLEDISYCAAKEYGVFKIYSDGKKKELLPPSIEKNQPTRVIISRRAPIGENLTHFLTQLDAYELIESSSALKFCWVAEGKADIYPRFGPTHEWDTAAGQCIVEVAGGKVVDLSGNRLSHNMKESLKNPHFLALRNLKLFTILKMIK